MIYPSDFEQRLGFDKIRESLLSKATTNVASEMVRGLTFLTDPTIIKPLLRQTTEMVSIIMLDNGWQNDSYFDTRYCKRLNAEGAYISTEELKKLRQSLTRAHFLIEFLDSRKIKYPQLHTLTHGAVTQHAVITAIERIIDQTGTIKDNASPELAQIRRDKKSKTASISATLNRIMQQAKSQGLIEDDATYSIRDGRNVIPITAANKRKIKGVVLGESATGKTAFVEPLEIMELSNEIHELDVAEHNEIIRILTIFTQSIQEDIEDIIALGEFVGTIEFIQIKANYAISTDSRAPIVEKGERLYLRDARHPLLEATLKAENKKVVPLNINLTKQTRILLISGPNAGGKSVCLKTVGLLQYMMQCGLLIPAKDNSEMGVFRSIFLDIGDQQSIENDLSTYSSHLQNMKTFIKGAYKDSLVLIDEFGGGTEPTIGGAISEAVLEELLVSKTFGVITTHYANLKYFASANDGIDNGAMTFDVEKIAPLFALDQGRAGSSFAVEIARKIGLPHTIVQKAQEKIGVEQLSIEKQLLRATRDKRYWEVKREKIKQQEKGVDRTAEQLEAELSQIKTQRTEIIKAAKAEAKNLLQNANKEIEKTIRLIKEAAADKARTKVARQGLEEYKDIVDTKDNHADIERKIAKIKRLQENREQKAAQKLNAPIQKPELPKKERPIEVGDIVALKGQSVAGDVESISGKKVTVAFGSLRTIVEINRLTHATREQKRGSEQKPHQSSIKSNFSTMNTRLNFSDKLDVRGQRADDALDSVKTFIDEAIMINASQVQILHGKGDGILHTMIRNYLKTEHAVKSYADEHISRGGSGITIVQF